MYDFGLLNPAWAGTRAAELTSDVAFLEAMLDVEIAWCQAQVNSGTAPQSVLDAVEQVAGAKSFDVSRIGEQTPDGANALIPFLAQLRAAVRRVDPAAEPYIHRGATSQDIVDTALMLMASRVGQPAVAQLKTAVGHLLVLAAEHSATVMVGRSLGQHAQPITFGYKVAQWVEALGSAAQDFETTISQLPVQWGGAVGTSTWWVEYFRAQQPEVDPMDLVNKQRDQFSAALGLTSASVWQANRMPVLQLGFSAFGVAAASAKIANDVLLAVQAEQAELSEPTRSGRGGSSAMPHKKNPVLSIRLKHAAQEASGYLTALQAGVLNNASERADGGWHTEWAALRGLLRATGAVAEILVELTQGLEVHPQQMRRNLDIHGDWLFLGRISAWLTPLVQSHEQVDYNTAYSTVDTLFREAVTAQQDVAQALVAGLPAGTVTESAVAKMLDPSGYTGGTAEIVADVHCRYRKWSS